MCTTTPGLVFVVVLRQGLHSVAQAGLELLTLLSPPTRHRDPRWCTLVLEHSKVIRAKTEEMEMVILGARYTRQTCP